MVADEFHDDAYKLLHEADVVANLLLMESQTELISVEKQTDRRPNTSQSSAACNPPAA